MAVAVFHQSHNTAIPGCSSVPEAEQREIILKIIKYFHIMRCSPSNQKYMLYQYEFKLNELINIYIYESHVIDVLLGLFVCLFVCLSVSQSISPSLH